MKIITNEGLIYMVPGQVNGVYYLRFAICAVSTERRHIEFAYEVIDRNAKTILEQNQSN